MSTFPISCGDHSFSKLDHEHALALVAMLGAEGVDLNLLGEGPHLRPELIRQDVAGWAAEVHARITRAGLRLADIFLIPSGDFSEFAPNNPDADARLDARKLFVDILDFGARIEAPGITMLPGICWPDEGPEDSLARAAEELVWRADRAASEGLSLSVEAHIGSVAADPERAIELLTLAKGLMLTLDFSHFVAQDISADRIEPLIPYARHLQLRGACPGKIQCTMSENVIDHAGIVQALRRAGYTGFLGLEYLWADWQDMNRCDVVSESAILRDELRAAMTPSAP